MHIIRNKLAIVFLAIFMTAGTAAFADDLTVPSWRGSEGSTFQQWNFEQDSTEPAADLVDNEYGIPLLRVNPYDPWIPDDDSGRTGIWPLSGEIDVHIPNREVNLGYKEIWIQLTWTSENRDDSPFLPDEPVIGIFTDPMYENLEMSAREDRFFDQPDDWIHSLYKITIWPNPSEEWITIKGDILVDQLVIDTKCVPEPGTLLLLGVGGLVLRFRRRQQV